MSQTLCCVICWGSFCTTTWKTPAHSTLSPQLAAFHLYNVDTRMAIHHPRVRYIRYMDDVLLLAPTRWVLRRAVRDLKHELEDYGFTLHPDKTRFGYTERDFDWMRLWFTESGVQTFAPRTISKHREQWSRALLLPLTGKVRPRDLQDVSVRALSASLSFISIIHSPQASLRKHGGR